ncbi:MAG TPA: right-handed parallel beta-helix repeat-containing protein, partial [Polyangiaceae bacterium]|nr:right-handed parallel beta-helix repeat-containing protein [Polyangiaceae bacterium]
MQRKGSTSLVSNSQSTFAVRSPMRLTIVGMLILGTLVAGCDGDDSVPDDGQAGSSGGRAAGGTGGAAGRGGQGGQAGGAQGGRGGQGQSGQGQGGNAGQSVGGAAGAGAGAGGSGPSADAGLAGAGGKGGAVPDGGSGGSAGVGISDSSGPDVDGARDVAAPSDGGARDAGSDAGIPTATGPIWVSPTGNDANPGTEALPLLTLQRAVLMAAPGITIWMMPGTHSYDARVVIKSTSVNAGISSDAVVNPPVPGVARDGTAAQPIRIWAVAGSRPVIDFKRQKDKAGTDVTAAQGARGVLLWAHYWHIRGLEIKEAADNCIHIAGSHNTIEDTKVHDCGDSGIQITVPETLAADSSLGAYNSIINCDSYLNLDVLTNGENADGFAIKDRTGPGNEFRGCRAWYNADDGWDFFYANEPVVIQESWSFSARHPNSTAASDGNGFKLGGQRDGMPANKANHRLTRAFAFHNPAVGFDLNNNTGSVTCTMCGAWGNQTNFESGIQHSGDITLSVTVDRAINAKRDATGNL